MRGVLIGFGLGFLVALQLGPMSLFLVRSTLRGGLPAGLGVGAGIATVDGVYAAAGVLGAAAVLQLTAVQTALGLLGAVAIAYLGVRSLLAARDAPGGDGNGGDGHGGDGHRGGRAASAALPAFRTALAATAANPMTILSWAAVFAAAPTGTRPALLVLGVFLGSLAWVSSLATGVAAVRRAVTVRGIQLADAVAGAGLLCFAAALAWHALR